MSNRYTSDFQQTHSFPHSEYAKRALIPPGKGPPPPMLTGIDPNIHKKHVLRQRGQYASNEKNITTHNPYPESVSGQIPMAIVDPLYDQHIIKPPKQNVSQGRIPVQQFVSSLDRNFTLYPSTGDYVVHLNDDYKNVIAVDLVSANIPNTASVINEYNNQFNFQNESIDDECLVISVPPADYSSTQLATELQLLLNQTVSGTSYTVLANTLTNKFEIAKNLSDGCWFKLCFFGGSENFDDSSRAVYPQNSIAPVLGYDRKDYFYVTGNVSVDPDDPTHIIGKGTHFLDDLVSLDLTAFPAGTLGVSGLGKVCFPICAETHDISSIESDTSLYLATSIVDTDCVVDTCMIPWIHKAPNKWDLNPLSYVILDIPELSSRTSAGGSLVANSQAVANSFAVIPMNVGLNHNNFVFAEGFAPIRKYFNPPISRLKRLRIRFMDYYGNIINFEGRDNFLEFRILTMNQPGHFVPGSTN